MKDALPDGLTVLDQSEATDQDSYNVTAAVRGGQRPEVARRPGQCHGSAHPRRHAELEERPYGPAGLLSTYGVTVDFTATGDTTVADLVAGTVNVANVYSADPSIQTDDLVTLADPKGLFLASNVVPLVNADIADSIADVINAVSAKHSRPRASLLSTSSRLLTRSRPQTSPRRG